MLFLQIFQQSSGGGEPFSSPAVSFAAFFAFLLIPCPLPAFLLLLFILNTSDIFTLINDFLQGKNKR